MAEESAELVANVTEAGATSLSDATAAVATPVAQGFTGISTAAITSAAAYVPGVLHDAAVISAETVVLGIAACDDAGTVCDRPSFTADWVRSASCCCCCPWSTSIMQQTKVRAPCSKVSRCAW
jgi:hypothetical protein